MSMTNIDPKPAAKIKNLTTELKFQKIQSALNAVVNSSLPSEKPMSAFTPSQSEKHLSNGRKVQLGKILSKHTSQPTGMSHRGGLQESLIDLKSVNAPIQVVEEGNAPIQFLVSGEGSDFLKNGIFPFALPTQNLEEIDPSGFPYEVYKITANQPENQANISMMPIPTAQRTASAFATRIDMRENGEKKDSERILLVTRQHFLEDGEKDDKGQVPVNVYRKDGKMLKGKLVCTVANTNLGFIELLNKSDNPNRERCLDLNVYMNRNLEDLSLPNIGTELALVSFSSNSDDLLGVAGKITSIRNDLDGFAFQTDAGMLPGNSGGLAIDIKNKEPVGIIKEGNAIVPFAFLTSAANRFKEMSVSVKERIYHVSPRWLGFFGQNLSTKEHIEYYKSINPNYKSLLEKNGLRVASSDTENLKQNDIVLKLGPFDINHEGKLILQGYEIEMSNITMLLAHKNSKLPVNVLRDNKLNKIYLFSTDFTDFIANDDDGSFVAVPNNVFFKHVSNKDVQNSISKNSPLVEDLNIMMQGNHLKNNLKEIRPFKCSYIPFMADNPQLFTNSLETIDGVGVRNIKDVVAVLCAFHEGGTVNSNINNFNPNMKNLDPKYIQFITRDGKQTIMHLGDKTYKEKTKSQMLIKHEEHPLFKVKELDEMQCKCEEIPDYSFFNWQIYCQKCGVVLQNYALNPETNYLEYFSPNETPKSLVYAAEKYLPKKGMKGEHLTNNLGLVKPIISV